jgi:Spy/CpxP family protein refolding chaperone
MQISGLAVYAQHPGMKKDRHEQIEKARIAFITERLSLTNEQSAKFWPVYNEFSDRRRQQMMNLRKLNKENRNPSISDEQIRQNLSLMLDKKQAIIDLEKEYLPKLLAIISPRQVDALQKAEKDFLKMLRKKIEQK